jgi:hypothetical protein
MVVGKPVLRITAFQVPESVLTMVGMSVLYLSDAEHCTDTVPKPIFGTVGDS